MLNKETIFKNKRDAYLSAILLNLYTYTDFNDKFAKIIIIIKHWKSRAKWKKIVSLTVNDVDIFLSH